MEINVGGYLNPLGDGKWELGVRVHGVAGQKSINMVVEGFEDFPGSGDENDPAQRSLTEALIDWARTRTEQEVLALAGEIKGTK